MYYFFGENVKGLVSGKEPKDISISDYNETLSVK